MKTTQMSIGRVAALAVVSVAACQGITAGCLVALPVSPGMAWILSGLLSVGVLAGVVWGVCRRSARGSTETNKMAQALARGDIRSVSAIDPSRADLDVAGMALVRLAGQLTRLVEGMKQSSVTLMGATTQAAATSRQQETMLAELGASTAEMSASASEIAATGQELLSTVQTVAASTDEAAELADAGQGNLHTIQEQMAELTVATDTVAGRLANINDRATDITSITTTIQKVADQTNLLSLNASIEAEKAGEHGLGFSVVAREIRRLADQTAEATGDIERRVSEMQSAVSSGVMEMDKFSESIRNGVSHIQQIGGQLGSIIEHVGRLKQEFSGVREQVENQSLGVSQMDDAITQLDRAVQQSREGLSQFHQTTEMMRQTVASMGRPMSHFQISEEDALLP